MPGCVHEHGVGAVGQYGQQMRVFRRPVVGHFTINLDIFAGMVFSSDCADWIVHFPLAEKMG
jgi:hypothetical protein